MATAADRPKKNENANPDKDKTKGGKSLLLIVLVTVIAVTAIGGGVAWYLLGRNSGEQGQTTQTKPAPSAVPAPALYLALEPAFVVNLNGPIDGPRYLQVEIQLMTRDPVALKNLQSNAPAIRAHLLMLLSQVQPEQIHTRADKEKLQAAALTEVKKLMSAETGSPSAENLLFTSFVTQ